MNLEGLTKRLSRRKVVYYETDDGLIIAKTCTKCRDCKLLEFYPRKKDGLGGCAPECKECKRIRAGNNGRKGVLSKYEGVLGKPCSKCGTWKSLTEYSNQEKGIGGKRSRCKQCARDIYSHNIEYEKSRAREYRENNKEKRKISCQRWYKKNKTKKYSYDRQWLLKNKHKRRQYDHKWASLNLDKIRVKNQLRRSRKKALPCTWTFEQKQQTWLYFENSCALTGQKDNLEVEHAIPISIGHGGTVFGNCYPLSKDLNISKNNRNIFEWFDANRQRFELSQERFDRLIEWLASANAISVEEYRDYVYWCHDNPRTVDELNEINEGGTAS